MESHAFDGDACESTDVANKPRLILLEVTKLLS